MAKLREKIDVPVDPLDLEDALSAREELEQVAREYQTNDAQEKSAKKEKENLRPALLDLMSEVVRDEIPLARRTEVVKDEELERSQGDFETWRARNFPEWTIVGVEPKKGEATVVLEENDALKKFEFQSGGFKFGRTFKMVGGDFRSKDFLDEVAKRDDIKRDVLGQLLKTVKTEVVTTYEFDEKAATALMEAHPETVAIFQEYTDPGKPQVSLLPISVVKE